MEDIGVDGRISKWIIEKQGLKVVTELNRLRIGSSGGTFASTNIKIGVL